MELTTPSPQNIFERLNNWIKESITVKLGSIGFLVLVLLIPQSWIESLMVERQARAGSVVREIADKWSQEQIVAGPVLMIPFLKHEKIDKGKDGIEILETKVNAFFLPEDLKIDGVVNPQILHRGIFEAAVYESALKMKANFLSPDFDKLNVLPEDIIWKEAKLVMGISDLRGISANPTIKIGEKMLAGEPSNNIGIASQNAGFAPIENADNNMAPAPFKTTENGIVMPLHWNALEDFNPAVSINLNLKGSTFLYFSPVGKTTTVNLNGDWPSPAFDGEFIPATRNVTAKDFKASWKIFHYNRPFSQEWIGDSQKISGSDFGVRLLIPVDQYQKSIRTAKYGVLVILLTFISLFMVEIMKKIRIHPFQYILIGAAMIVYYSLLLSFSEQLGFDIAYIIATIATITLVTFYAVSFLSDRKTIILFSAWMVIFYGFIFVIVQQQDYSLLLGSVGLFMIVGAIMYFSRAIKWYGEAEAKSN